MVMGVQLWTVQYPTREVPLRCGMSALEIDLNWRNFVLMPGGVDIVHVPDPRASRRDPWCEERTAVGLSAFLG
jgi:hypothetical protein